MSRKRKLISAAYPNDLVLHIFSFVFARMVRSNLFNQPAKSNLNHRTGDYKHQCQENICLIFIGRGGSAS